MAHYVLILAGGQGTRLNNSKYPKQFLNIGNKPMLMHSIKTFKETCPDSKIYVGLQEKDHLTWLSLCKKYNFNIDHKLYLAGNERFETVFAGLNTLFDDFGLKKAIVSIHDSARPFIDSHLITDLLQPFEAINVKSTIPVIGLKNAILDCSSSKKKSLDRNNYLLCQTPQCFNFIDIFNSYKNIMIKIESENTIIKNAIKVNLLKDKLHDDLAIFSRYYPNKKHIKLVQGREHNIKITNDLDYFISEKINDFVKTIE